MEAIIMAIWGYYLKPNFFTGITQEERLFFYLTDGGRDSKHSPIMRIKDVYVSINTDINKAFIVIPKAYTNSPFFAEFNLNNSMKSLHEAFDTIFEWLGLKETWRRVGRDYKQCTVITITDGEIDTIDILKGENQ